MPTREAHKGSPQGMPTREGHKGWPLGKPIKGTHEGTAVCDLKNGSASLTVQVTLGGTEADRAAPSNVWRLTAMPSKTKNPKIRLPEFGIPKPRTQKTLMRPQCPNSAIPKPRLDSETRDLKP